MYYVLERNEFLNQLDTQSMTEQKSGENKQICQITKPKKKKEKKKDSFACSHRKLFPKPPSHLTSRRRGGERFTGRERCQLHTGWRSDRGCRAGGGGAGCGCHGGDSRGSKWGVPKIAHCLSRLGHHLLPHLTDLQLQAHLVGEDVAVLGLKRQGGLSCGWK